MKEACKENSVCLVLEGGGQRGIYTAGVLDQFLIEEISADGILGVSAGILHGVSFVSKQLGRDIRYNLKYKDNKGFMSISSFITTGDLCNKDFCYNRLPNELSPFDYDTYRENAKDTEVYAVCSNLETGKAEYLRVFDLKEQMDAIRASASLPMVSQIVEYEGMKLLDGGTCDSIPVKKAISMGFDKIIVVLTQPKGYRKKQDKSISIIKKLYKDYPDYVKACENRYIEYNETLDLIEELEENGEILVLRPSRDLKLSRTEKNDKKIKRMYKLGRFDVIKKLDVIKKFML